MSINPGSHHRIEATETAVGKITTDIILLLKDSCASNVHFSMALAWQKRVSRQSANANNIGCFPKHPTSWSSLICAE